MGRLIDADEFIKYVDALFEMYPKIDGDEISKLYLEKCEEVNKLKAEGENVIKQLEEEQQKSVSNKSEIDSLEMSSYERLQYSLYDGQDYAYQRAIEIVKAGGKNE